MMQRDRLGLLHLQWSVCLRVRLRFCRRPCSPCCGYEQGGPAFPRLGESQAAGQAAPSGEATYRSRFPALPALASRRAYTAGQRPHFADAVFNLGTMMNNDGRVDVIQGVSAKLDAIAKDLQAAGERLAGLREGCRLTLDESIDLEERLAAVKKFVADAMLERFEIGQRDGTAMSFGELLAMAELGVKWVKGTRVVPKRDSIIRMDGPMLPGQC